MSHQSGSSTSSSIFSKLLLVSGLGVLGAAAIYYFRRKLDSQSLRDSNKLDNKVRTHVAEDLTQKSSPSGSPAGSDQTCLSSPNYISVKKPILRKTVSFLSDKDNLQFRKVDAPVLSNTTLSPTTLSPLPSTCDCREMQEPLKILADDEALFRENLRFEGQQTKVKPFNFQKYDPVNFVIMAEEEFSTGLSPAARQLERPAKDTLLTAFNPVLQCIIYTSKHVMLLDALIEDYAYLGES